MTSHDRPRRRPARRIAAALSCAVLAGAVSSATVATSSTAEGPPPPRRTGVFEGVLPDGATWTIEVPPAWDGTLLLYGHGLVPPGAPNPVEVAPDPITREHLLARGVALAGSSYATTGWAVEDAVPDQVAVADVFAEQVGLPTTTVAWGSSLGGLVTAALLEQHPERFDGGLSLCGPLAGGVGLWDTTLDALYVLTTLLEVPVDLVATPDPPAAIETLQAALDAAQTTPLGRARIGLAAAVADIPGWLGAGNPRPDRRDVATQQAAQYEHLRTTILLGLAGRADLEARAGSNPSTNVGVDYAAQLRRSGSRREVEALYRLADRQLGRDLHTLQGAPRIAADPPAVAYLEDHVVPAAALQDPFVTLHTNGDQLATVEHEQAFAAAATRGGTRPLLRQLFTERAGHCTFTPAEVVTALDVLLDRVAIGRWPGSLRAAGLDARASSLGPALNVAFDDETSSLIPVDPAFSNRRPGAFLRPSEPTPAAGSTD